jgi:hypothetical protein
MRRVPRLDWTLLLLITAAMFSLSIQSASAQANRASITGTVRDTSGAVVPGVEVTATSTGTNEPTKTVSNEDGIYVVPNLFPGQYSLEFKRDGFETLRRPSITLESTQVARIDAALKVGATSESMTVTADAPVLDQENGSIGTNMKGSVVTDLPLSIYSGGRFAEEFAVAITPGYSPISSPYGAVINGGQWFTKDYTVDGTSATANIPGDSLETGPSMEAVQELQAQTSGLDAQSSITGGGVISFNLKSGTNKFHGSGFLYGHNELLDANSWTNDNEGLPKSKARAWDLGGSLGGPIFRNKTFFFGAFERYTQNDFRLGGSGASVPTTAFLGGDFSALLGSTLCTQSNGSVASCSGGGTPINVQNDAGQTVPLQYGMIFDPVTGNQFTGNMIPTTMFSGVAQKIIPIYQQYYTPELGGINGNLRGLIDNSPSQTPNQIVVKLDHNLRNNDRLSGSWVYNHRPRTLDDSGGVWAAGSTDGGPLSEARLQLVRSQEWRVTETHTFSPRILNVLNLTYNWYWNGSLPTTPSDWNSDLGFAGTGANNFPSISFSDATAYTETGIGNTWQGNSAGATFIVGDGVTWTKGKHNITFGGDFHAQQVNSHTGSGALSFNFSNNATGAPTLGYGNQVGFAFASFLLGDVQTASQTTPFNLYGREKEMSLYVQDSYKLRPNLTVNLGLRWNYNFRFHEKNGSWANYDLQAIDPTLGIPGTLIYAKNGSDSFEKDEYAANFGPQIGLAYSPWKKVVFRGSFGIVYFPPGVPYFDGVPDAFAPGFQGKNSVSSPFNWGSGTYPGVFQPGNKNACGGATQPTCPQYLFPLVNVDPEALRVGYSDAFNAGVQYELTPNMRIEVAYVGNRGHRLTDTALGWNEGSTSTFLRLAGQLANEPGGLSAYSNPVCAPSDAAGYGIAYPYPGFCGTLLEAIAPYPQVAQAFFNPYTYAGWYYPSLIYVGLPRGQSYYDSMVIDVVKRTGRGLTMDMSYTLSRQEGDTFSAQQEGNNYYTEIQDFNNVGAAAHSLTNYDQRNIVKGFIAYQLPFGKGERWLSSQRSVVNRIVGGWSLSALLLYTSGQPFQVSVPNQYSPMWGNFYPNFNLSGFTGPSNPNHYVPIPAGQSNIPSQDIYIPQSVASTPAPGTLGTGPLDTSSLRCPGQANENASALKYVPMGSDGQYRLSFRVEFYNLFNRHYYNINGCGGNKSLIQSPGPTDNFGEIFGVTDNPRTGQFAIRFDF